jgi:hypothetical protein
MGSVQSAAFCKLVQFDTSNEPIKSVCGNYDFQAVVIPKLVVSIKLFGFISFINITTDDIVIIATAMFLTWGGFIISFSRCTLHGDNRQQTPVSSPRTNITDKKAVRMGSSSLVNEVPHTFVTITFVVIVTLLHRSTLISGFGTATTCLNLPHLSTVVPSPRQRYVSNRWSRSLSPIGAVTARPIPTTITTLSMVNAYGRGAEIWPECNEDAVQLADSFPNGHIPFSAIIDIQRADMNMMHKRVEATIEEGASSESVVHTRGKTKLLGSTSGRKRQYLKRILRRAAAKEEIDSEGEVTSIDRTPIAIGLALVLRGLVRPIDVLVGACLTAYITVLGMVAQSTARDFADTTGTAAPILPAIPPQGHVPTILIHPLGRRMEESRLYDTWLKLGVAVGMVGPVVLLMRYSLAHDVDAARFCARPLFLLCCQVVTEAICSKRITVSNVHNYLILK